MEWFLKNIHNLELFDYFDKCGKQQNFIKGNNIFWIDKENRCAQFERKFLKPRIESLQI